MFFDPMYFLFVGPFFLLGMYAQWKVKSTFRKMSEEPARMTGFQAARLMLDSAGLQSVQIEPIGGTLSDHYDPSAKVLRLSPEVYGAQSMAAVGVACHEAGHAMQDAERYAPLVIRNAAVPAASFGSNAAMLMFIGGMLTGFTPLLWIGIIAFAAIVFFQVINLPVEFDASARAKRQLVAQGIITDYESQYVSKVLNAAALTYVAGTLQAVATLAYLIFSANRR
ncbi:Putative neutral zinc metallopeptidase [Roseimaritima multifibrata]|uniref:Neutral zinc metallopeptidase n=1 Tax=Roseimaritima multifibrata TaxID=1930274 RepID=A0A517MDW5_9BACT|nr:zinc metallopeptidase [Roseimaritima multifibrata]QDS93082.1 Putative neutral zinc metallopeptidase [Roseimaritima multifibrata]